MISIYVLLLENNKYYVGQTKNFDQRMKFHTKGKLSSDWTKKYQPIKVLEINKTDCYKTEDALKIENLKTIECMRKFGWKNVRGGDFCTLDEEKLRFLLVLHSNLGNELLPIKVSNNLNTGLKSNCFFVLKLLNDNYFVGRTNNLKLAVLNEYNGLGSEWTKIHKPTELLSIIPFGIQDKKEIRKLHNAQVITYMKKFGFHNVRGGDFFKVDSRNHKNKVINYTDIFSTKKTKPF